MSMERQAAFRQPADGLADPRASAVPAQRERARSHGQPAYGDEMPVPLRLRRRWRQTFWQGEGVRLLTPLGCGWIDGGCRIAAEGLIQWLSTNPETITRAHLGVVVSRTSPQRAQHFVAALHEPEQHHGRLLYLDADGPASQDDLLTRMVKQERIASPLVCAFDPAVHDTADIPYRLDISQKLARLLEKRLGQFRWTML